MTKIVLYSFFALVVVYGGLTQCNDLWANDNSCEKILEISRPKSFTEKRAARYLSKRLSQFERPNSLVLREGEGLKELYFKDALTSGEWMPLSPMLPQFAADHINTFPPNPALNCYHACLSWHNPSIGYEVVVQDGHGALSAYRLPEIRPYILKRPIRMDKFLKEHYRELTAGEALRYGDAIILMYDHLYIRYPKFIIDHTMIYLNDDYVWQKPGLGADNTWQFARLNDVIAQYADTPRRLDKVLKIKFYRYLGY